jgi:peroxiredoxin
MIFPFYYMEKRMNQEIPDIGQDVPDFEVVTSGGETFKLSEELKSGQNVKLMFYRGHW